MHAHTIAWTRVQNKQLHINYKQIRFFNSKKNMHSCSFYEWYVLGSCQEKLQTIFGMFDVEGRGILQKADLSRLFR